MISFTPVFDATKTVNDQQVPAQPPNMEDIVEALKNVEGLEIDPNSIQVTGTCSILGRRTSQMESRSE